MAKFLRDLLTEANKEQQPTMLLTGFRSPSKATVGEHGWKLKKTRFIQGSDLTPITLHEGMEACGDSGSQNLDDLLFAATGRNPQKRSRPIKTTRFKTPNS